MRKSSRDKTCQLHALRYVTIVVQEEFSRGESRKSTKIRFFEIEGRDGVNFRWSRNGRKRDEKRNGKTN